MWFVSCLKDELYYFRTCCCFVMSRRDDRDRSRTRRRQDRSPSSQPRKARRREHNDSQVSDGVDWNNLVSWQHNSGYNTSSAFPVPPGNYQSNPSSTQQFHHAPVNYMMPFPPEPTPAKFVTPVMPPPDTSSQATPSPGYPAALPVRPQKAWLNPPDDWKPGDGMFDINQLYVTCLAWTSGMFAWFRSYTGASPTGYCDHLLTGDS